MPKRLLWKLLGVNILTLCFIILIVWLAVDYLAAGYFIALMKKYNISPTASHQMFLEAVHRYLLWASIGGVGLASVLSLLIVHKLLRPLEQMTRVAGEIAAGQYRHLVPVTSTDEIGKLASAFNRMAASLDRIEQLRKKLMIDVAHELRSPLTNLRGYLEALVDGVVPASRETFELLLEQTLRLAQLVEDILRLARADAAGGHLQTEEIQLSSLIRNGLDSFAARLRAKDITVDLDLAAAEDPVMADPQRISQVLRNLLENVCQYTPAGGSFRIVATRGPDAIQVLFANSGGGLSESDVPFIFERFYRGEKSRSRVHGGAGIGLAIVKELIHAHQGEVGAEVAADETRVWFTLPL